MILNIKAEYFKKVLKERGSLKVKVNGNSMWPFLKNGDIAIVKYVDFKEVHPGDIVFTYVGSNILCHRVFDKRGDSIVTKADTFIGFDPPVRKDDLIGKVTAKEKKGKVYRLNKLFSYRIGFLISRISLALSFCYLPLRFIKRLISASFAK